MLQILGRKNLWGYLDVPPPPLGRSRVKYFSIIVCKIAYERGGGPGEGRGVGASWPVP